MTRKSSHVDDDVLLASVNTIGAMLDATVVAVIMCDPDGRPFCLPHPDLPLGTVRLVFQAFADSRWNASKSL